MPTFFVEDLSDDLHARLCERARRDRRSISEEAIVVLESVMMMESLRAFGARRAGTTMACP